MGRERRRNLPRVHILALLLAIHPTVDAWTSVPLRHTSPGSVLGGDRRLPCFISSTSKVNDDSSANPERNSHRKLEDDINKKLSISRDRAISALSKPNSNRTNKKNSDNSSSSGARNGFQKGRRRISSSEGHSSQQGSQQGAVSGGDSKRRNRRNHKRIHHSKGSAEIDSRRNSWRSKSGKQSLPTQQHARRHRKFNSSSTYSSLLPPPLTAPTDYDGSNDPLSSGLSSWEEFLGFTGAASESTGRNISSDGNSTRTSVAPHPSGRSSPSTGKREKPSTDPVDTLPDRLPSIKDLFPPDLSSVAPASADLSSSSSKPKPQQQQQPLEGVLPVSDLFYRSSQSQDSSNDARESFSPGQSDSSTTSSKNNSKNNTRRNLKTSKQEMGKNRNPLRKKSGRRMVRKGMEMLVGGVPISADPPQRSIELSYDPTCTPKEWASTITLNTGDFGPLLHTSSAPFVTDIEKGLFCEYFCYSSLKWDICAKDLRGIVKSRNLSTKPEPPAPERHSEDLATASIELRDPASKSSKNSGVTHHDEEDDEYNEAMSIKVRRREDLSSDKQRAMHEEKTKKTTLHRAKGFAKHIDEATETEGDREKQFFEAKTELLFDLSVPKADLESGKGVPSGAVFKNVLASAFCGVVADGFKGFEVDVSKLVLTEKGDGNTSVDVEFAIFNNRLMTLTRVQRRLKRISAAFLQAVDDGDMQIAIAAAARLESRWSDEVRDRVLDECLFEEDDDTNDDESDGEAPEDDSNANEETPLSDSPPAHNSLFVGGGINGIFPDYSAANAFNSPYHGEIGLRLVDAVVQRAKDRQPRIIAIGDVHGCIDELQDLLRQCDYRPGDLVVFLGDLVCKGPDSISVVQMAREIGAIGVRGNHDFEVIRWHQAIKNGVDPPVVGSEHFHIASCLSKSDMKWMYNLPWFISSKELGSLFVHAGFVSGIRLAKQNPRLMMNMRSILPDGTVTSKFFNNWPWARLWDGQLVLFGHDADRGLQQYENAIGLDTGCVYGGRLTACILPEKRLVSVSARREYFKYRRKHYD